MKKITTFADSSMYDGKFKQGEYIFGEFKDKIVINKVLQNITNLSNYETYDYYQNNADLKLFTRTFQSQTVDENWSSQGLGDYAYDYKKGSLQTYKSRVFSDVEGWLIDNYKYDKHYNINDNHSIILSNRTDYPFYTYINTIDNDNLLSSNKSSVISLSHYSVTPLIHINDKNNFYLITSGHLRKHTITDTSVKYVNYISINGCHQGYNILKSTRDEFTAFGFDDWNRTYIYKYSTSHELQKYLYINPDFPTNTSGRLPIDSSDGAVGIHNMSSYDSDNSVTFISQKYSENDGIEEYFVHKGINIIDNNEAPYIETYIDSDGVEQEYDMTLYYNKQARYFGLFKLIVNHNNRTFYYKRIDIDYSVYPDWYADDRTSTTTMVNSYGKSSTISCYDDMYGCKAKLFTIDDTQYLLTLSATMNSNGNKYLACIFTITGDSSVKLECAPFIYHDRTDSYSSGITLIDDHDFIIHRYRSRTFDKMRVSWNPTDGWIVTNMNNYYNNFGMYIDKTDRIWNVNMRNDLYIGTYNDIAVKYLVDMNNTIQLNGEPFEIKVKLQTILGILLQNRDIIITLNGTNITFDDDTSSKTITTDNNGELSFNVKIPLDSKEEFTIDYKLVE